MTAHLQGIVHGKVIQLLEDPGLPDGEIVSVSITKQVPESGSAGSGRPAVEHNPLSREERLECLKRADGALRDDPDSLEDFWKEYRELRHLESWEIPD